MHPTQVLFPGTRQPVSLPVCDHYAGSEKLMRKSIALQQELGPVFDITLDCEDGASTGNETAHAHLVAELITGSDNHFGRLGVRVHDITSAFFESDVATICSKAAHRLAYLMLPKVNSAADVQYALDIINHYSQQGQRATLPLHILIETHGALAEVSQIAALPQVESLSFGIMDFVSSHYGAIPDSAMHSPGQFTHPLVMRAKTEIAAACHAYGKVPSHNVTTELRDMNIVSDDAISAATRFGYTRMWSIHPHQIKAIVQAFAPNNAEIETAAHILQQAENVQWGPVQVQGHLHDRASYRYYWNILQRAHTSGMTMPVPVASWFPTTSFSTTITDTTSVL